MKKVNSRVGYDYEILEKTEAGLVLNGAEAKAVRGGHVDLSRSFAKFLGTELYLINASIPVQNLPDYQPTRSRKILLHKRELFNLLGKITQKKLTIIPLSVYTKGRRVKLEIALARSKREYEKRESIKRHDIQRDIERELR